MSAARRGVAAALAAALLALASGCADGAATGETDAATAAEPFAIGLAADVGGLRDHGLNQMAHDAFKRAEEELGAEIQLLEPKSDADYFPNLQTLAERGLDLVVAVGAPMTEAAAAAAQAYPETRFVLVDPTAEPQGENVVSLRFAEHEAGFLAGFAAALASETGTVSAVGGERSDAAARALAGFQAGAAAADGEVRALTGFTGEPVVQEPCRAVALDQIAAGSDVVFHAAGRCGLGVLDAARERGVWAIGFEGDQGYLGEHVLTSALKRVDTALFAVLEEAAAGELEPGTRTLGIGDGAVGLAPLGAAAPRGLSSRVEALAQRIASGEVEVPTTPP